MAELAPDHLAGDLAPARIRAAPASSGCPRPPHASSGGRQPTSSDGSSPSSFRYPKLQPQLLIAMVLNMLACWIEDPSSEAFKLHVPRIYDYLWFAEDGMKMQGYNGSQLWDTAFAVQAIAATGLIEEFAPTLKLAHDYIKNSQKRTSAKYLQLEEIEMRI